jgi:hypothetical protein
VEGGLGKAGSGVPQAWRHPFITSVATFLLWRHIFLMLNGGHGSIYQDKATIVTTIIANEKIAVWNDAWN